MENLYILTTSDVPNHVLLGHASFAIKAGFDPVFVFPDRKNHDKYASYYTDYNVLKVRVAFSNKNFLAYIFSIIGFSAAVFKLLFFKKDVKHILAVDLEGTLAAVLLKLKGTKVYCLVNDNFCVRYNLNKPSFILIRFFESVMYKLVSNISIFPHDSRVELLGPIKPGKILILPNVLNDETEVRYVGNGKDNLVVLVCGWLTGTRGLDLLKALLNATSENVEFLLVGSGNEELINELSSIPRITYLGHLSREENLNIMATVDINFAFYNPSIPINRHAMPQKVSDSILIGCPILINSEVQMAETLFKAGVAFSMGYWDILGVSTILNLLMSNKQALQLASKNCIAYQEKSVSFNNVQNEGISMYRKLLT